MTQGRKSRLLISCGALTTLLAGGCADQEEALIIRGSPGWTVDEMTGEATCIVDPSADFELAWGRVDVLFNTSYFLPVVLINNLLVTNAPDNSTGIENNEVQLLDADIRLELPQDSSIIDAVRSRSEALVEFNIPLAGVSIQPQEEQGVIVEVLTPPAAAALREEIRASDSGACAVNPTTGREVCNVLDLMAFVRINGKRHGSAGSYATIASREYQFPIKVCLGCLADCSACGGSCPSEVSAWGGGVCGAAQETYAFVPSSEC